MKSVKTALGRTIDMSALAAKNEKVRAISNVPVNARGDIIDNRGNVKIPREKVSKEYYKNTVPGSDEKAISVKEESGPKNKTTVDPDRPIEVSRVTRQRGDGTSYDEVEYSDGSMEEQPTPENKNK